MDSTKTAIKALVLDLRKSLEADLEVGLRRYGITSTALRPLESLGHLDDRGKTARIRMEEGLRHEMERSEQGSLAESVHWFVREVAFTHLNRLVGLKALEVRGLTPEIIQTRAEYGNRSRALRDYREAHPAAASLADDGLEEAIQQACRQIYPEFRLLFDVGDPAEMREAPVNSLVWPSTPTLKGCIAKINELDAKIGRPGAPAYGKATAEQSVWAEDEIIGWVYQFYNAEEKVSIRDKGKPQHPAEVAVINQFFTPRWIVKFLVDNTLGRLWLEMHPDSPRVRTKCDYLVPEPAAAGQEGFDPDSPVNNPEAEPRRKAKRPQDIRLIDPACGTMHFGHYAFEVFQEIYADAREQGWVKGAEALDEAEVPAAILQNNLFGVDIDLRAVQLAALSLFMKAKSANPDVRVGQVNLVVADAHLPQGRVREDFLAQYKSEPVIQKAFAEVFESLDNVAEVGSLLRVEERFRQSLAAGGFQSQATTRVKPGTQGKQAAFAEIMPGWSLENTVEQMLGHLRQFARHALQEHDLNAQLFAAETEKSVALLDVFLHEYDVVVMNPPYGESTSAGDEYIETTYSHGGKDFYSAFVERSQDLTRNKGFTGILCSRTFMFLSRFKEFREYLINDTNIIACLETGVGLLDDASVRPAAMVLGWGKSVNLKETLFAHLGRDKDFQSDFLDIFQNNFDATTRNVYWRQAKHFGNVPESRFAYWVSNSMLSMFEEFKPIEPIHGVARAGCSTGGDERFVRCRWEVAPNVGKRWKGFNKGGSYQKYYYDFELVIDWSPQSVDVLSHQGNRLASKSHYFKKSIAWTRVTERGASFRIQPIDHVFSDKGPVFVISNTNSDDELMGFLGLLNARLVEALLLSMSHERSIDIGSVRSLPLANTDSQLIQQLTILAKEIYGIKQDWDLGNETNFNYDKPYLLRVILKSKSLHDLVNQIIEQESLLNSRINTLQAEVDLSVFDYFKISSDVQALIERELGERPAEIVWPYAERMSQEQKASEHVARLMSYCLLAAIQADPDGILPLTEASGQANALRQVQGQLETHFGESAAYQVELDSAAYLGRPLGEWLLKNFWKDFHVKWYKNRPVLWQLQSQKGHFACLVQIHKMDRDTLPKVRSQYLWPTRNACQAALESARLREDAGDRSAAKEVARLESMLDDLSDFEKRLASVIEAKVKCAIPAWAQGPYRNGVYDPVLDDGVAVNILPLQEAGILAKAKVV